MDDQKPTGRVFVGFSTVALKHDAAAVQRDARGFTIMSHAGQGGFDSRISTFLSH